MESKVYLSRRNLLTLLSKLDRIAAGEQSHATIIKYRNDDVSEYQQSMKEVHIVAVEDALYYAAMDRLPGVIHPDDEKTIYGYK